MRDNRKRLREFVENKGVLCYSKKRNLEKNANGECEMEIQSFDINKVYALIDAYKQGKLGGEKMPEDENPSLDKSSKENYLYFTLPMALNYQRNSYTLWECANKTYIDLDTANVFDTKAVVTMDEQILREKLVKYKVALQPNKQPIIWRTICETVENDFAGDIRLLFSKNDYSVQKIKEYIAKNKKKFPYLGGNKICNYWLYVMEQYTDVKFVDRENITVAPDTHVIQASERLGIISMEEVAQGNVQEIVANRWQEILKGTDLVPIDVHTPMWLWSRGKFSVEI